MTEPIYHIFAGPLKARQLGKSIAITQTPHKGTAGGMVSRLRILLFAVFIIPVVIQVETTCFAK